MKPDYAKAHNNLGLLLVNQGKLEQAVAEFRLAIHAQPQLFEAHGNLTLTLKQLGQWKDAVAAFSESIKSLPQSAVFHNDFAWLLATCPDPTVRDPGRAVKLAQKAIKLALEDGDNWNTLGVAQYRAGDWTAAIGALEKSMDLRKGGDSGDWFFLAMAHWKLGDKEKARTWFDQAVQWMEKNKPNDEEFRRFRAEAEELMKVEKMK